jgi:hypothetical protein
VVGSPFTEIITMARHLAASRIETYLSAVALEDIRNPATPAPQAGEVLDAADFLDALSPRHLTIRRAGTRSPGWSDGVSDSLHMNHT